MKINEVTIQNFRSISKLRIKLDELTPTLTNPRPPHSPLCQAESPSITYSSIDLVQ